MHGVAGQLRTIAMIRRHVRQLVAKHKPDIIHAHSPCLNGIASYGLGVPLVYEMRSSWEDAAVSEGVTTEGSLRYRMSAFLETWLVRRADAVTVICQGLKDELESRGVRSDRIAVVPNAVPDALMGDVDSAAGAGVRKQLGVGDGFLFGYFGSFLFLGGR